MRRVIVSQATRRDAHNLDERLDRWKLQKDIEANVEYLRLPDEILEGLSVSSLKTVSDAQAFKDTLQERYHEVEFILSHYNKLLKQYGKKPYFVKMYKPRREAYIQVMARIKELRQQADNILIGTSLTEPPSTWENHLNDYGRKLLEQAIEEERRDNKQFAAEQRAEKAARKARLAAAGFD